MTEKDDLNNVLSSVEFRYNVFNLRIAKIVDADGPGGNGPTETYFSWESNQIALQFDGDQAGDLAHRYLYGPQVDQVLADEAITSLTAAGDLLWPLADHLGTVRDLAEYDTGTNATTIANHIEYDSYGNVTAETNAAVDHLFAFTGRERDDETDLQYNRARYYDLAVGRWLTEDPIGFAGRDLNLYRYVKNDPLTRTDPKGTSAVGPVLAGFFLYEVVAGIICDSLYEKAVKAGSITPDPGLHSKHCYVSCCLNKANLWVGPGTVGTIGLAWEVVTGGIFNPSDALEDLANDFYGIYASYLGNCAKCCN